MSNLVGPIASSQASLLEPQIIPLYAEVHLSEGELKTRNETPDEIKREQITYRGRGMGPNLKADVQLVLCAHGWATPEKKQRTSLLVFDYRVNKTSGAEGERVESVKTEWVFREARVKSLKGEKVGSDFLFLVLREVFLGFAVAPCPRPSMSTDASPSLYSCSLAIHSYEHRDC